MDACMHEYVLTSGLNLRFCLETPSFQTFKVAAELSQPLKHCKNARRGNCGRSSMKTFLI